MANRASVAGLGATGPFGDQWLARAVLNELPVAVWLKDADGRYLGCNEVFETTFGVVEADILGGVDTDFIDAERSALFRRQDLLALASDDPVTNEETVRRMTDGAVRRWETTKTAIRGPDGEPLGVLGIGFDITDRAELHDALIEREHDLAQAEQIARLGSWRHDLVTDEILWSAETYRIFGRDPGTFVPTRDGFIGQVHPDDLVAATRALYRARDSGEPFVVEFRVDVDGEVKHVENRGRFETDARGTPVCAIGTVQDVTEQVRAARRVASFYHLVDRASDAIVLVDAVTGRIVEANQKAQRALRGGREALTDLHVWDVVEQISERWWLHTLDATDAAPDEAIRYDLRRLDGTTFPADVSVELVDEDGRRFVIAVARDVSDRLERERALVRAAEQYRALVDGSQDGFVLVDDEGRIRDVNDVFCEQCGYTRDELFGMAMFDLDAGESPTSMRERIERVLANGGEIFEAVHRRKDGSTWPVEVAISHADMPGGRMFAFVRDLTERHEAERELRLGAERWSTLLAGTTDGFVRLDASHRIRDVNQQYCELVGRDRSDLIGRSIAELDASMSIDDIDQGFRSLRANGSLRLDTGLRHADGHEIPVEVSVTYSPIEGGQVLSLVRDQREHLRLTAEIERMASRFDAVMSSTRDGFLVVGADGVILEASDRYLELSGWERDALVGMLADELDGEQSRSEVDGHMAWIEADRAAIFETHHRRPDGSLWPVEISSTYSPVDGGQFLNFVRDLTERRRAEQAVREAADRHRALLAGTIDGFARMTLDGTIVEVNDRLAELVGVPVDRLVGANVAEFDLHLSGDRLDLLGAMVREVGSTTWTTTIRRPDGTEVPVDVNLTYDPSDGGQVLTFARDISERVAAERELRESADRYATLKAGTADGFLLVDEHGIVRDANETYCELSGYLLHELVGLHISSLNDEDSLEQIEARIARVSAGNPEVFRSAHRAKDGTRWPVEISLTHTPAGGGRFVTFVHDLRRQLEAERAVHEASERLDALLSGTKDAFCMLDLEGRVLQVNDEFCRQSGYDADAALQLTGAELAADPDLGELRTLALDIQERGAGFYETTLRRRDSSTWPVEVSLTYSDVEGGRLFAFIRDITERREAERRIEFLAYNDVLTGLPNRPRFSEQLRAALDQARRDDTLVAVCYLDLDGFKPVNDRFGHEIGDVLLVQLGQRLRRTVRPTDEVARFGGDEFVILLRDLTSIDQVRERAGELVEVVGETFNVEGQPVHLSASIGITVFPDDDGDEDAMLRHADQAMHRAKDRGKNTFELFDPVEDNEAIRRRTAIAEFETALHGGELALHYQPRIDLRTGAVVGVEALVRWPHPTRGLLPPSAFLPLVESSPLEFALDDWVLAEALRQLEAWLARGLDISVSVNITPRHIAQAGFPDDLARMLSQHPAELAGHLELEVLETSALGQVEAVAEIMRRCSALGVRFSLDDFGTGYSSLTYFHSLPVSVLKIDQDFVRGLLQDPGDLEIVEGVIQLAAALDRPVVAEGVETAEIGLLLLHLGCQFAQGFGIARPMPPDEIPAWIVSFADDPTWQEVVRRADDGPDLRDLDVVRFSHHRWATDLVAYLEAGAPGRLPRTSLDGCPFARWYAGVGMARYGELPAFAPISELHEQVHVLGRDLVLRASGRGTPPADDFREFESATDRLSVALDRLTDEARSLGQSRDP